jgi:hypothetical protein
MPPSAHFLLGFASSILAAVAAAVVVLVNSEWLKLHGISPPVAMLVAFLAAHFIARGLFRAFVKVTCPAGCGTSGYPIRGRSDRFRCDKCGLDF